MLSKIKQSIQTSYEQEALASRLARIKWGVFFAVIGATVYIFASALVNIISYPKLPLGINWLGLLGSWAGITLAIVIAAAIAGWSTENYVGVVGGGVVMTALLLIFNLINALTRAGADRSISKVVVSTLPMIGVCILVALTLRMMMNRQLATSHIESKEIRVKKTMNLFGIVLAVGLITGIFSRYDFSTVQSLELLNNRLASTETPEIETVRFPENVAAQVKSRYGTGYEIFSQPSSLTLNALDTTIRFDDGYTVTCLIPSDSSQFLVIPVCSEGTKIVTK